MAQVDGRVASRRMLTVPSRNDTATTGLDPTRSAMRPPTTEPMIEPRLKTSRKVSADPSGNCACCMICGSQVLRP
jgi:hypothetical protein